MAGLYIHIPFCRKACHYCNFHFSTSLEGTDKLIRAMVLEMEKEKDYTGNEPLQTIYFGGGPLPCLTLRRSIHYLPRFRKTSRFPQMQKLHWKPTRMI